MFNLKISVLALVASLFMASSVLAQTNMLLAVNSLASVAHTTYVKPMIPDKKEPIAKPKPNTICKKSRDGNFEVCVSWGSNWLCVWFGDGHGGELGNICFIGIRVRAVTAVEILEPLAENEAVERFRGEMLESLDVILEEIRAMPEEGER